MRDFLSSDRKEYGISSQHDLSGMAMRRNDPCSTLSMRPFSKHIFDAEWSLQLSQTKLVFSIGDYNFVPCQAYLDVLSSIPHDSYWRGEFKNSVFKVSVTGSGGRRDFQSWKGKGIKSTSWTSLSNEGVLSYNGYWRNYSTCMSGLMMMMRDSVKAMQPWQWETLRVLTDHSRWIGGIKR